MSKLIEELKQGHVLISEALDKVKIFGVTSKQGQDMLTEAKSLLLNHLAKEDSDLYPSLRRAAEKDKSIQQTLDIFAKDMDGISKAAMDFFEKYIGDMSGIQFAMDFGNLVATLKIRIMKEEQVLYQEFEKLNLS